MNPPSGSEKPQIVASDRFLSAFRLIFLALVLAGATYVRIRLLDVPLERDEGEYAYLGQLLLKGFSPFQLVYSMKLPGVGIVYALIMQIFGETVRGIHLGLLAINIANALLVYLLARRLLGRDAAPVSCATYVILSLSSTVLGVFAHATHLVVLFSLLAFLALLRWLENRKTAILFLSGTFLGLAIIMKQHAAILTIFALLYLIRDAARSDAPPPRSQFTAYTLFLTGICLPYALTACWMAVTGNFGTFWFWTASYSSKYASKLTLFEGLPVFNDSIGHVVLGPQLPLWLLGALGGGLLFSSSGRRTDRAFLCGLTVFSFLTVCPGFYFRYHYFITFLPAVALLTGFAVATTERIVSATGWANPFRFIPLCIFIASAGYGCYQERGYLFSESPFQVSRTINGVNPFPESLQIARYLREHTSATDTITIIGSEPQIYFYTGRPAGTSYIYMYGLMEQQPYAESMQAEMIRQIDKARSKYIVVVNTPASWLQTQDSPDLIFHWMAEFLPANYTPVGIIDIPSITKTEYLWDSQVAGRIPESVSSVIVYQRKN